MSKDRVKQISEEYKDLFLAYSPPANTIVGQIQCLLKEIISVRQERDRLEVALEWYADEANWQILRDTPKSRRIDFDKGERARQGLGREP